MIYLIVGGAYSDWWIDSYFTDKDKAEKYIVIKNKGKESYDELYIQEVEENKSQLDYDNIIVKKHYTLVFDWKGLNWVLRDAPDRYNIYTGERKPTTSEEWHLNNRIWSIGVTAKDYDQAKKVAFDRIIEAPRYIMD